MGDYNRVQSYIKSHVLPKLDSLPHDVQSVKQAFDAWKADWTQARAIKLDNLDAKISSRASSQQVDGVRGGVDTTLQRLTALDGKVNPWDLQPNVIVREIVYGENAYGKNEVLLNVYGKGKLLCVGNMKNTDSCDFEVNMDTKKELNLNFRSNNNYGGCYICQSCIRAVDKLKVVTSFGDIMFTHETSKFIADEDEFSYMSSESTFFTSYKPIVFNTSLTVTVKNKGNIRESTCLVAYSLD